MDEKLKQQLVNKVLDQIKQDINFDDVTAIEELLNFIPDENLIQFLPEDEWKYFKI